MSTKFLHALSDDPNLEKQLEKQIGCMTGLLQLFDRHQLLTGKRLYGHKRLPSARSSSNCGSPRPDENIASVHNAGNEGSHTRSVESVGRSNAGPSSSEASGASSIDHDNTRLSVSLQESTTLEKFEAAARASWDNKAGRSMNTKNSPRLSLDNRGDASIMSKELPRSSLDSRQTGRLSLDIRDVVRDSFYRDPPKLSVETKVSERAQSKQEPKYVLKPKDSPRPLIEGRDTSKQQQPSISLSPKLGQKPKSPIQASTDTSVKSRTPVDLNESLRVLAKLREASWNFAENKEPPRPSFESREGPRFSFSKDSPRFSYDGRENHRSSSFDFKDAYRSSLKLKEPPRLSLDSRENLRNSFEYRNFSVKDMPPNTHKYEHSNRDLSEMEQQSSDKKRSPSVVARLMGLEEMPTDSTPISQKRATLNQNSSEENSHFKTSAEARKSLQYGKAVESPKHSTEKDNCSSRLSKNQHLQTRYSTARSNAVEETADRMLSSPRSIQSSNSPRLKHPDALPKTIFTQRCPIETAPWRQQDSSHGYQKKSSEAQNYNSDVPKKNESSSHVLYSEIEKKLKQLEVQNCDKDLRTLKQILEAMQHKGFLDSTKEFGQNHIHHQNDFDHTPRPRLFQGGKALSKAREMQGNQTKSGSFDSERVFEAPIVIMKPAKLLNKSSISSAVPMESFYTYQRKVGPISQTGSANTKRSTMGSNRAFKDQQSGRPNSREAAYRYSNEIVSAKHTKRENKIRTKSEENSGEILQKGRARSSPSASSPQPTPRIQHSSKVILNNGKNNSNCSTAKLQRKKAEIERKSKHSATPKSSRQTDRVQTSKQNGSETENPSPRNRIRIKGVPVLRMDEEMSENSRDTGADQYPDTPRADEISLRSDSNISSISHMDFEVTSSERSYTSKNSESNAEYDWKFGPLQSNGSANSSPKPKRSLDIRTESKKPGRAKTRSESCGYEEVKQHGEKLLEIEEIQLIDSEELSTENTPPDHVPEQPSPVSVLDAASFYKDDSSPSPVKKCSITFKDDEIRRHEDDRSIEDHWNPLNYQTENPMLDDLNTINQKMLKNVHSLVRKLEDLNSTDNSILQLETCRNQNQSPEYKYVSEILLSSGLLLEDSESISMEFHSSGFPINPELFNILEQKRITLSEKSQHGEFSPNKKHDQEKLNRKHLFGTVNDILRRKLCSHVHLQPWIPSPHRIARRRPTGQQLLKEVWEVIEQLPCSPSEDICDTLSTILQRDFAETAEQWCGHTTQIAEVVLDVERMIFKDLIDETLGILGHKYCRKSSYVAAISTTNSRRQLLFN
eukprot:Gb_12665 [translate_table: standard]